MRKIKSAIKFFCLLIVGIVFSVYLSSSTTETLLELEKESNSYSAFEKNLKSYIEFEEDLVLYLEFQEKFPSK